MQVPLFLLSLLGFGPAAAVPSGNIAWTASLAAWMLEDGTIFDKGPSGGGRTDAGLK